MKRPYPTPCRTNASNPRGVMYRRLPGKRVLHSGAVWARKEDCFPFDLFGVVGVKGVLCVEDKEEPLNGDGRCRQRPTYPPRHSGLWMVRIITQGHGQNASAVTHQDSASIMVPRDTDWLEPRYDEVLGIPWLYPFHEPLQELICISHSTCRPVPLVREQVTEPASLSPDCSETEPGRGDSAHSLLYVIHHMPAVAQHQDQAFLSGVGLLAVTAGMRGANHLRGRLGLISPDLS
ncbi:hypothetical protein F4780DRAFT_147732 [Xylariomycetidae sp. FL0641]|nr:hypothetical protein F4780DRAFT_147732 [Xylariomycetidae sp. FL0641]